MNIDPELILFIPVLLLALVLHEIGHAYAAYLAGDDTARLQGRISLNPFAHIDPIGTVLVPVVAIWIGFPFIGWAKPVPINPRYFKKYYWNLIVALAGVSVNFALAIIALLLFKVLIMTHALPLNAAQGTTAHSINVMLGSMVFINIMLGIFNLIPIPPLDGSHVLFYFIRTRDTALFHVFEFLEKYGMWILLILVYTGVLGRILRPVLHAVNALIDSFLG